MVIVRARERRSEGETNRERRRKGGKERVRGYIESRRLREEE